MANRILILGGRGMLGHKLVEVLGPEFQLFATVRHSFDAYRNLSDRYRVMTIDGIDLIDGDSIASLVRRIKPEVVINAAGIVKQARNSQNVVDMLSINSILPHRLAALSKEIGFRLICISTDCVFSGAMGNYCEADQSDARDLYGISKALGEVVDGNCLTIRTSIIGREIRPPHGLLEWFLAHRGGRVKGFTKAIFSGFPTIILCRIIRGLLLDHPEVSGLYHVSSQGISKYDLLTLINERFKANITLDIDDSVVIDRSLDSTKFRQETGFEPLPWPEMIDILALDSASYDNFANERSGR